MAKREPPQPTLFTLIDDPRPAASRRAADRYLEPDLFSGDQPPAPKAAPARGGNVVAFPRREG